MTALIICSTVILLFVLFLKLLRDKCPECKGHLIEDSYDAFLGKAVYKCTKCGKTFVLL